jgi:hypothetical protein
MTRTSHDLTLFCLLIALVAFGHIAAYRAWAGAGTGGQLQQQGAGMSYGEPVNERIGALESQARKALHDLGSAESSYASGQATGRYAHLHDLRLAGLLQPNATGKTLVSGYSVTFLLSSTCKGFTLLAEPTDLTLRPMMVDETQNFFLLTPSVSDDPDAGWTQARDRLRQSLLSYGYYMFPISYELSAHDPPLQVRLDWPNADYLLFGLKGVRPDPSMIYSSYLNTYLTGTVMTDVTPVGGGPQQ